MASSNNDESFVWLLFIGLLIWVAYDKWWKEDEPPSPPAPLYTPPIRPTGEIYITATDSGTRYLLVSSSVRGDRSKRAGWVTMDHSKDKTRAHRTSKELYIANCDEMSYRTPSFVTYNKKGEVQFDWDESEDDKAETQYAIPDTIGESIVESLCDHRFDPVKIPPPVTAKR